MRSPFRLVFLLGVILPAAAGCGARPPAPPAQAANPADAHPNMPDMPAHAAAPAKAAKPPDKPAPAKIVIDDFAFQPNELTVPVGTEVSWINRDDVPHTATSTTKPKAFDSGALDTDQTYSHVFTTVGEYEYFCAVHPHMTGKVVVK